MYIYVLHTPIVGKYICIVVRLIDNLFLHLAFLSSVVGIYKRKQQSKKTRFRPRKRSRKKEKRKKIRFRPRKNDTGQEKKKENTL